MTYRRLVGMRGKRGISPVIATVILVAVAITVAVSVAFWMGGITGQYTRFEKLQVQDPLVSGSASSNYTLTFTIKNIGSTDATIDSVFVNGKAVPTQWNGNISINGTVNTLPLRIASGASENIQLEIDASASGLSAGTTIEVKFHSASGYEYPKMVTLP